MENKAKAQLGWGTRPATHTCRMQAAFSRARLTHFNSAWHPHKGQTLQSLQVDLLRSCALHCFSGPWASAQLPLWAKMKHHSDSYFKRCPFLPAGAGSAHCLPPGRCVMAIPTTAPPNPWLPGTRGPITTSRGGSGRHQAESCWQLWGSEAGSAGIQLCTAGFPSEATPPNPGITANFRPWKMKGLGTLGLSWSQEKVPWLSSCQLHRPWKHIPTGRFTCSVTLRASDLTLLCLFL